MSQVLHVNERISVGGALGTIKYSGFIDAWPEIVVYGVEWDESGRGKNDGSIDGKRYFQCEKGRGSFIKTTNSKIERRFLFVKAVEERYSGRNNVQALRETIHFGLKKVERFGFDKLNSITHNYTNLAVLMLDKQCVLNIDNLPHLPKLEHLDLSYNLLTLWSDIDAVMKKTPKLASLNLNGNRFSDEKSVEFPKSLTHLSLCDLGAKPLELPLLRESNLQKIDVGRNGWTDDDLLSWELPSALKILDLSYNQLENVPDCIRNTSISKLILLRNKIAFLGTILSLKTDLKRFPEVTSLDLRHNLFSALSLVDHLPQVFPNLIDLRWSHCPVFFDLLAEEMTMNLIGRLPCCARKENGPGIVKLNGSDLLKEEIADAEAYMASKIRNGEVVLASEERTLYLSKKYNIGLGQTPEYAESDKTVLLRVFGSNVEVPLLLRRFMRRSSVLRLKGVVAKHIQLSVLSFSVFYYVRDDETTARRYMDDDIASLASLGLISNQRLYVSENMGKE